MLWALISRFQDFLAIIGFVMVVKWSVEIALRINNAWRQRVTQK